MSRSSIKRSVWRSMRQGMQSAPARFEWVSWLLIILFIGYMLIVK